MANQALKETELRYSCTAMAAAYKPNGRMIILVAGLPGVGKSYFAQRLSRQIGAVYVKSDGIRNATNSRGKYTIEDKMKIYQKMAHQAKEVFHHSNIVVVDATFYREEMRGLFYRLAETSDATIYFILITASDDIIRERLRTPRKDSEADYGVYTFIRDQFESPRTPHLTLESGRDNILTMVAAAKQYIRPTYETA